MKRRVPRLFQPTAASKDGKVSSSKDDDAATVILVVGNVDAAFLLVNSVSCFGVLLSRAEREVSGFLAEGFIGLMLETNNRTRPRKEARRLRDIECPNCEARFFFRRARIPHFDSSGFESYQFVCMHCGASLAGVIDPFDGALLLSTP